jgi:hypothetical protein
MWVWCLPGVYGVICNEFAICYPVNVIQSVVTPNPAIISVTLGDLPSGISVCYIVCQWDWFWCFHQTLYVTDPSQTTVYICAHPDIGVYQIANCEPGYPTAPIDILNPLWINYGPEEPQCQGVATQHASWGAIKRIVGE